MAFTLMQEAIDRHQGLDVAFAVQILSFLEQGNKPSAQKHINDIREMNPELEQAVLRLVVD